MEESSRRRAPGQGDRSPRGGRGRAAGSPPALAGEARELYTSQAMTGTDTLYFFPDQEVTTEELEAILQDGPPDKRAWAISHLLRYAQWEDIWSYVSRDEVREIFPELDLPENLRSAWGRMLKIEAPVG